MASWILLRGMTREARHWGSFPDMLRAAGVVGEQDRLIVPDLPGNGTRCGQRSPTTIAAITDEVRLAAHVLGLDPPFRLLAMSLGGMVATDWASRHPGDIERVVLINTSVRQLNPAWHRLQPRAVPLLIGSARSWHDAPRCEAHIHALTCANMTTRSADLAMWAEIRRDAPVSSANALRQLLAAARYRVERQTPDCPVLVLSSAGDRLVAPVCSARLADAWNAPHRCHPWAGHDLPHDDPAWVAGAVRDWLRA